MNSFRQLQYSGRLALLLWGLLLNFTNYPAKIGLGLPLARLRPIHQSGVCIAALIHNQTFSHARAALLDFQPFFARNLNQPLPDPITQTRVARITNQVGLHGCIDIETVNI